MVNSVQRLEEIKAVMRMGGSASDLKTYGWDGDGSTANDTAKHIAYMPGIEQDASGDLHFAEWNCRAGQNNVIIRTDGTLAPCFPMYSATYDWGVAGAPSFESQQLAQMKQGCQPHCFSTLNHNLAYCYHAGRAIKW